MKSLIFSILGFLFGMGVMFLIVYYFVDSESSRFIDSQLIIQEQISKDAFIHFSLNSSNFNQINYNAFAKKAYDAGLIDGYEYNKAASLANIRLCINFEESDDIEKAKRHCNWAQAHYLKWSSDSGFELFKSNNLKEKYLDEGIKK